MKLELLNKKGEELNVLVKGANPMYMNTLRRAMISEVPVMAIEKLEIRKNSSALYDEIVGHRLGLLSLKTDLKTYSEKTTCKCKGAGCASCELVMTLQAKGPCIIYASDIKSKDPKVVPTYPKTPIVKLLENQEVEIEMTAVLGRGKEHTKWSPCLSYYRLFPKISAKDAPNRDAIVESCPVDIFELKSGKLTVNDKKIKECILCNACTETSDTVKVETKDEYLLTIESFGQLSPKDILENAIEQLNQQFDEVGKLVKAA